MIDLYCGLGGWAEGFLAEGYDCIGFDVERHDYGTGGYPGQLVLQDVLTLDGAQFKGAACIVASPPCQAYSYRAMPWKRAKALPPPDNELFDACFRIQREASAAAGRPIPLVVENVKGAQPWVGRAAWHYGSYYLWGDVPALMPWTGRQVKGNAARGGDKPDGTGSTSWFFGTCADPRDSQGAAVTATKAQNGKGPAYGGDFGWDGSQMRKGSSHSASRKAASAQIAKIPFALAQHIAQAYKPQQLSEGNVAHCAV
jgi:hypothetical protein